MKKMLFILVSMLCLLLSAGCGSDKQAAQAPAADKVLRVATSPASPPFELYLKEQNKFTGFDIDLINDVAKKWAMTRLNLLNTPFDELLPRPESQKYDIAMNNFSKTKARSIDYAASDSYAKAAFSIVAKKWQQPQSRHRQHERP